MIQPDGNQRWRERKAAYRRIGEGFNPAEYEVVEIAEDNVARAFVEAHHYAGTYPAARWRFGLMRAAALVGVAVFSVPCNNKTITSAFPGFGPLEGVELGRFVLLEEVPGNAETWFLARTFELLRGRVLGVVSFSDPCPRTTLTGETVFLGHYGQIYQAHNAVHRGRGTARTLRLLPDARVFSDRAISKVRSGDRGWRYAAAQLVEHGADPLPELCGDDERRAWLATWLPQLTRPLKHPGNFRYLWTLERRHRKLLGPSDAYPRREAA